MEKFNQVHFNRVCWEYNGYNIRAFNVCEAFEDRLDFWYHVWLANTKVMQIENDIVIVQFTLVGNSDIPKCYVKFPIGLMNADFNPLEWKVCGPVREECGDIVYTISKKGLNMTNLEAVSEYMKGVVCKPGNEGMDYDKMAEKFRKLIAGTLGTDKFEITKGETPGSLMVNLSPEAVAAYHAFMEEEK